MKVISSRKLWAALSFVTFAVTVMAASQAPQAGQGGPPTGAPARGAAPGGAGGGRGGGRGGPAPLGDGPFDVGEGENRLHVTVVTKGLDHPWGMAFLPNGDMLVSERAGRLRVIRNGVLDPTPIGGLPPMLIKSLGGLLDIAVHPNFAQNRFIYFAYSKPGDIEPTSSALAVYRAKWDGGATITEGKDIFIAEPHFGARGVSPRGCCGEGPADGNSYGSRIAFDKAGFLFITSGDRNIGELAQNPLTDIGKILRIKDDGTIPNDNPFVGKVGYLPEIYTLGHRNPLGLTIDPMTGRNLVDRIWPSRRRRIESNPGGQELWLDGRHQRHPL
jgi:glucose/arabinose dehydrogenase